MIGRGLGAVIVVVGVDQLSKILVLKGFGEAQCVQQPGVPVTQFFEFVLTCNRGMSFGLFNTGSGLSSPIFISAAVIVVGMLFFWLYRAHTQLLSTAIGMIIGGAIGNLIDRSWGSHGVIDFLYFHLGSWYWPAFNAADSAICSGVFLMVLEGLLTRRGSSSATTRDDPLP